jgi:hypothetical protein
MSISPLPGQHADVSGIIQSAGQTPWLFFGVPPPGSTARMQALAGPAQDRVRPVH